jgi:hypothetical protein
MTKLAGIVLLFAAACSEKYEPSAADLAEEAAQAKARESAPAPVVKKRRAPPPADLGSCKIEVTGGITAEQTSPGGKEATNVAYWYAPEERKNMMGVDGYVVNCKGDKFRFSLLPGGGKLDGMPFAPKKFTFVKGKSDGASLMMMFGQATEKSQVTLADANGTVDITAIDVRHIAGTIDITGKVVPGNKKIAVKGSFDLVCPGLSGCDFGEAP